MCQGLKSQHFDASAGNGSMHGQIQTIATRRATSRFEVLLEDAATKLGWSPSGPKALPSDSNHCLSAEGKRQMSLLGFDFKSFLCTYIPGEMETVLCWCFGVVNFSLFAHEAARVEASRK